MLLVSFAFLLLLASYKATELPSLDAFTDYNIAPNYIPAPPPLLLYVRYGDIEVELGNYINPYLATYPPYITYDADYSELYTLLFFALDNPSRLDPYDSPYLHLLVVNIPGNNVTAGNCLTAYVPPTPIPGSNYHRYVLVVYRQSARINTKTNELLYLNSDYSQFSVSDFVNRYNLGNPCAGNFFLSQTVICNDDRQTMFGNQNKKCG